MLNNFYMYCIGKYRQVQRELIIYYEYCYIINSFYDLVNVYVCLVIGFFNFKFDLIEMQNDCI